MDGFAALSRYIIERSPYRRLQPNAGLMIADPDAAAAAPFAPGLRMTVASVDLIAITPINFFRWFMVEV